MSSPWSTLLANSPSEISESPRGVSEDASAQLGANMRSDNSGLGSDDQYGQHLWNEVEEAVDYGAV